jgi:hypothetical protein
VGLGAVGPTSQPQCLIAPDPCSSSERAHMLPYVVQGGGAPEPPRVAQLRAQQVSSGATTWCRAPDLVARRTGASRKHVYHDLLWAMSSK